LLTLNIRFLRNSRESSGRRSRPDGYEPCRVIAPPPLASCRVDVISRRVDDDLCTRFRSPCLGVSRDLQWHIALVTWHWTNAIGTGWPTIKAIDDFVPRNHCYYWAKSPSAQRTDVLLAKRVRPSIRPEHLRSWGKGLNASGGYGMLMAHTALLRQQRNSAAGFWRTLKLYAQRNLALSQAPVT